jgi:hypothetical protein
LRLCACKRKGQDTGQEESARETGLAEAAADRAKAVSTFLAGVKEPVTAAKMAIT